MYRLLGIPISLGASIMAILSSLDPGICHSRLAVAGFSEHMAGVLFGVYGKVQTLFNLPAAFMTPLTIAIVPAVAGAIAKGNRQEAEKTSEDAMRIASVISMPMGVGLAVLSFPIVNVLYPKLGTLLNQWTALFVCTILRQEKYRYSYGRKWVLEAMNDTTIRLPQTPSGKPDWAAMERKIKGLPYGDRI